MRILVAGDWHSEVHEEGVYQAYKKIGHEVFRFSWHQYFQFEAASSPFVSKIKSFWRKFQDKFIAGPIVRKVNRDFVKTVNECNPDVISLYRGTHITKGTLRSIKKSHPSTCVICHNEDDPFTEGHPYWLWRHFLASIPEYDLVLAHRLRNVQQYKQIGAKNVQFLRSWYAPERNHPVTISADDRKRFECDVVFVGHYERDGRVEILEEIVKSGFKLRLFGPGKYWDPVLRESSWLRYLVPVQMVWGENYNMALCGAKAALCFLSKLNRDTYTRRCFEIPATGTLMLSEYTADLATMLKEGEEADYFRSKEELLAKLSLYLRDDGRRRRVAEAGRQRIIADGHDVVSRMKQVIGWVQEMRPAELNTGSETLYVEARK